MVGRKRFCDGIVRRDFLRIGSASMFGTGLLGASWEWPRISAGDGSSRTAEVNSSDRGSQPKQDRSLVIVFLRGGLSTIDTWDLKPDAPVEFRGEFQPISTNVPAIQITEYMPRTAQHMDKFSLIRSFGHRNSDHGPADHYMLTGYHPIAGFNPGLSPNNQFPAHGAIMAKRLGPRGSVPPYVCVPDPHPSCGSAYLGPAAAPFSVNADPNDPGFSVRDVTPPIDIDPRRVENRKEMLAVLDRFRRGQESRANRGANTVGVFRDKAYSLMASEEAQAAFNIHAEKDPLRDEYGRNSLGQSCLMARRLVEAGVRCVTIHHVDWDTHEDNFVHLKRDLLPILDSALSTFFRDLADRGLLESTMVVVMGEIGRTPRINKQAGRDHWGPSFTVAIGGGGLKGGIVVGKSDARAEKPAENPYGPEDLAATIHRQLGIDPETEFLTPEGRPVKVVNNGRVIRELI